MTKAESMALMDQEMDPEISYRIGILLAYLGFH